MNEFWKTILIRFLKGAVASAVPLLAVQVSTWKDLTDFLNSLLIAGIFGGISGLILATDKAWRWQEGVN